MTKHPIRLTQTIRVVREITLYVEAESAEKALELAQGGDFPDGDYRTIDSECEGWNYEIVRRTEKCT